MEIHVINLGELKLGPGFPVRVQTMTNTPTQDVESTVAQTIRCIREGAELVRITTPTLQDVVSLAEIKKKLYSSGYPVPLVADVHFNPKVAEEAAKIVEKVRINPGNYIDKKAFRQVEFSEKEYALELEKIHSKLLPLLNICKDHGTAIRIGVNHGSLSDRIMSRYGDTVEGMVQSAMEFVTICRGENFHQLVLSMKASNIRVMIYATRLLNERMHAAGYHYPLHLGVTEAGEGEDGRIKSAVGIGALLAEGIGDTIRVSLTEDPEKELPVAHKLVSITTRARTESNNANDNIHPIGDVSGSRYRFIRSSTHGVAGVGGNYPPVLVSETSPHSAGQQSDLVYLRKPSLLEEPDPAQAYLCDAEAWEDLFRENHKIYPVVEADFFGYWRKKYEGPVFVLTEPRQLSETLTGMLAKENNAVLLLQSFDADTTEDLKYGFKALRNAGVKLPVILVINLAEDEEESLQVKAGTLAGSILADGLADGFWLRNAGEVDINRSQSIAMGIMQACRLRTYRTEYIACPSCGRTLFNLTEVLQRIREKTNHLSHLKIGVMGCIVNGPGEMADADYGYVGAGPGRINLYKRQELVRKNIPEEDAVEELLALIRENGDWREKIL